MVKWILQRLQEPSTWRGAIYTATAAGVALSPDQQEAIIAAGLALVGVINVFRNETKQTADALIRK